MRTATDSPGGIAATHMEAIYRVESLSKSYAGNEVLHEVSFDVRRGESLVFLGRSGSGKSVTLRQLIGLEASDGGEIWFDGEPITDLREQELYPLRKRVSMLFQSGALFDSMNVIDNVVFPLREHSDLEDAEIISQGREKLELVGLRDTEELMPSSLSGGMRKRVALARSLALEPEVVLFDEPTTGLDPITAAGIGELIRRTQHGLGSTSVIVTHDLHLAATVADRIAFLHEARLRFTGTWNEARRSTDEPLERFLSGRFEETDEA